MLREVKEDKVIGHDFPKKRRRKKRKKIGTIGYQNLRDFHLEETQRLAEYNLLTEARAGYPYRLKLANKLIKISGKNGL